MPPRNPLSYCNESGVVFLRLKEEGRVVETEMGLEVEREARRWKLRRLLEGRMEMVDAAAAKEQEVAAVAMGGHRTREEKRGERLAGEVENRLSSAVCTSI
jgi:hypothetical protein